MECDPQCGAGIGDAALRRVQDRRHLHEAVRHVRIDLQIDRHQGELVAGSSLTGGCYYFEDQAQVAAQRVVITDSPLSAMAYATLHLPAKPTIYLATHQGRFVPGDKFSGVEVVVATQIELENLLEGFERHLPAGDSWMEDLKSDLAKLTSKPIEVVEPEAAQIPVVEVRRELEREIRLTPKINQPSKSQDRGR